jgi:hypothetical protein
MGYPSIRVGSKPVDGGHLIVTTAERNELGPKPNKIVAG